MYINRAYFGAVFSNLESVCTQVRRPLYQAGVGARQLPGVLEVFYRHIYLCMYICVCVCMYIYIYIYACVYIYIDVEVNLPIEPQQMRICISSMFEVYDTIARFGVWGHDVGSSALLAGLFERSFRLLFVRLAIPREARL